MTSILVPTSVATISTLGTIISRAVVLSNLTTPLIILTSCSSSGSPSESRDIGKSDESFPSVRIDSSIPNPLLRAKENQRLNGKDAKKTDGPIVKAINSPYLETRMEATICINTNKPNTTIKATKASVTSLSNMYIENIDPLMALHTRNKNFIGYKMPVDPIKDECKRTRDSEPFLPSALSDIARSVRTELKLLSAKYIMKSRSEEARNRNPNRVLGLSIRIILNNIEFR